MARPHKNGLDYFPLDVDIDQDDKLALIEAEFGMTGFAVIVKLYMKIYKSGYYYEWTDKEQLLFSNRVKMAVEDIQAIVEKAMHWKIFNRVKYDEFGVLTSAGIQERFIEATTRRKRVNFMQELCCDGVNVTDHAHLVPVKSDINQVNVDINPTKERRVNKSKVEKHSSDSEEMRFAELLLSDLLILNPRLKKPNLQKWASEFALLMRVDKRTPKEITDLLEWLKTNTFWRKNILSPAKLRLQFDRLTMETKNGKQAFKVDPKYANIG